MYQVIAVIALFAGLTAVGAGALGVADLAMALLLAGAMFALCAAMGVWAMVPAVQALPGLLAADEQGKAAE